MGEYKEASMWLRVAFFMCIFGFFNAHFGWAALSGKTESSELALFIIALVTVVPAAILIVGLVLWDELKDNKIATIIFAVLAIVAGAALLIGMALFAIDSNCVSGGSSNNNCYGMALAILLIASACEIVAGIFGILAVVKK